MKICSFFHGVLVNDKVVLKVTDEKDLITIRKLFKSKSEREQRTEKEILLECEMSILKFEKCMMENKFHMCMYELDSFLRNINKYWTKNFVSDDKEKEAKCIANTLHYAKVAMVMLHSVAPKGIENLAEYLKVDESIFTWDRVNETIYNWFEDKENHKPKFIEAKFDFFKKHPSQFATEE